MKKAIFLFAMIIGLGSVIESKAQVVDPDRVVELKATKKEPARGNQIKAQKPTTDEMAPKVDKKARGYYVCDLKLENWSDYCMDVYIDGNWKCTISPKSYYYTTCDLGYSSIYAESCGQTMFWTKQGLTCNDAFTYRFYN